MEPTVHLPAPCRRRRPASGWLLTVFAPLALFAALLIDAHPARAQDAYRLGAGDKLRVTVYGEADLSGEFEVDGTGFVALPLIGELSAGGSSVREMERRVETELANGYLVSPRVSIEVTNYRPFYILGEVNNPGRYPFVDGMTVQNAVALAGGYTYRARQSRAEIQRQDGQINERDAAPSTPVMPGDVITIPERFF